MAECPQEKDDSWQGGGRTEITASRGRNDKPIQEQRQAGKQGNNYKQHLPTEYFGKQKKSIKTGTSAV